MKYSSLEVDELVSDELLDDELLSVDELSVEELSSEELDELSSEELSELLELSSELSGALIEMVFSDELSRGNSVFDLHPQRKTAKTSAAVIFFIITPFRLFSTFSIIT